MRGTVYLVGAGPGAADLLTLRAARLISAADVVLHDALVTQEVIAIAKRARKINVGKRANRPSTDQRVINRLMVRAARENKIVVRLKGGDPMLFGRAQEEIEACRSAGVPVEVVPGVSAAFAAAAEAHASLTQRGVSRSVVFVTPMTARDGEHSEDWADAAAAADSVAIYMGAGAGVRVRDALLERGVSGANPVVLVERAGRLETRRVAATLADLEDLVQGAGEGPALLLMGEAFASADAERLAVRTRARA
jgi:uroporphyrin-III C-methyltransferase